MGACSRCGTDNPAEAKFCFECATPLGSKRAPGSVERKVVTAMFCDLVGSTARAERADPEDVHATLSPYQSRVKNEIERYEGTVEKFVGDAVMAVFGAPVVHEDDPERAIRAGLSILDAVGELNNELQDELAVRIGINTGEMLVSLDADPAAGETMVAGDAVNTAARLQSVADEGTIVVGETTYRATRDRFEFSALDPVILKGRSEPVSLWRVVQPISRLGIDTAPSHSTSLVGRELELRLLQDTFLRSLRDSCLQLVTISGEPGVGKSRLVAELGRFVDDRPELVNWRQGRCLPYGEGITFWALGELVKAHAGILESDDALTVASKLDRVLPVEERDRAWLKERLAVLVGLRTVGAAAQQESFTAWRRFLERIAESGPTVLVVEDLHWADDALLEFLEYFAAYSQGVPIVLVCTARPELYSARPGWAGGIRNAATINLTPLNDDDTGKLISNLLGSVELPASLERGLLERAEGNPLYVEESIRLLRNEGLISEDELSQSLAGEHLPLPESVKALIAARLDTLEAPQKLLIQDASIVGKVFWDGAVAAIGELERDEVKETLHALSRSEFVRQARTSSVENETEYSFLHTLVREVAYSQIPRAKRAERHRRAALWIEQISERLEDSAEILAHHYTSALELVRAAGERSQASDLESSALKFLLLAGERALGLDTQAAEIHLEKALSLTPQGHRQRAAVLSAWARAAQHAGRTEEAVAAFDEAAGLLQDQGDNVGAAAVMTMLANALGFRADVRTPQVLASAVSLLESEHPGPELVAAYSESARHEALRGASKESIVAADKASKLADELGLDEPAKALGYRGLARLRLGDVDGVTDLRRALRLAVEGGHWREASLIYNNLGVAMWSIEGPQAGVDVWLDAIALAEERGIADVAQMMTLNARSMLLEMGSWDEVLESDVLAERLDAGGSERDLALLRCYQARALALLGRADEAREMAERAATVGRDSGEVDLVADTFPAAALVRLSNGDIEGSLELLRELDGWPGIRESESYTVSLPMMVRTAVEGEDPELAESLLLEVGPTRFPYLEAAAVAAQAVVTESRGEWRIAAELYADAALRARSFGVIPECAYALLGQGRCLLALGDSAAVSVLREAHELFSSLRAGPGVAEAEALLERATRVIS